MKINTLSNNNIVPMTRPQGSASTGEAEAHSAATRAGGGGGADRISLSGSARFLQELRQTAGSMEGIRPEVVEAARADLEAGRIGTEEDYERAIEALLMESVMQTHTPPEALVDSLRQAAQAQLVAARRLDAPGLEAATGQRLHATEALLLASPAPERAALARLRAELEPIDLRLGRLLQAGQRSLRRLRPGNTTYDPSGRLREGSGR